MSITAASCGLQTGTSHHSYNAEVAVLNFLYDPFEKFPATVHLADSSIMTMCGIVYSFWEEVKHPIPSCPRCKKCEEAARQK